MVAGGNILQNQNQFEIIDIAGGGGGCPSAAASRPLDNAVGNYINGDAFLCNTGSFDGSCLAYNESVITTKGVQITMKLFTPALVQSLDWEPSSLLSGLPADFGRLHSSSAAMINNDMDWLITGGIDPFGRDENNAYNLPMGDSAFVPYEPLPVAISGHIIFPLNNTMLCLVTGDISSPLVWTYDIPSNTWSSDNLPPRPM